MLIHDVPSPWGLGLGFPDSGQSSWCSPSPLPGSLPPTAVHSYTSVQPEMDRVMEFYETARVDGLIKREETPKTMTEYYQGRPNFLSYRHVNFGPRVKKLTVNSAESIPRPKRLTVNSAESNPRPMVVSARGAWAQAEFTQDGENPNPGASSFPSYDPGAV